MYVNNKTPIKTPCAITKAPNRQTNIKMESITNK